MLSPFFFSFFLSSLFCLALHCVYPMSWPIGRSVRKGHHLSAGARALPTDGSKTGPRAKSHQTQSYFSTWLLRPLFFSFLPDDGEHNKKKINKILKNKKKKKKKIIIKKEQVFSLSLSYSFRIKKKQKTYSKKKYFFSSFLISRLSSSARLAFRIQ